MVDDLEHVWARLSVAAPAPLFRALFRRGRRRRHRAGAEVTVCGAGRGAGRGGSRRPSGGRFEGDGGGRRLDLEALVVAAVSDPDLPTGVRPAPAEG